MKFIYQKFWFMMILILGSLITISSNSWLNTWIGLEINLLSFIVFMIKEKNLFSSESVLLYFIFQTFASLIFLFSIIMYMLNNFLLFSLVNKFFVILIISIMMKLGSAPFHFWLPLVMESLNWMTNFIIMTWQKFAPLILLFYIIKNNLLLIFMMMSMLISLMGGINQTSLRKMMAYSSINQISWLVISLMINELMFKIYFFIYIIIILNLILLLKFINIYYLNQLFNLNLKNFLIKILIFMNIMSMGGLPPFLGFFSKMLILKELMFLNLNLLIFFLLMSSLVMLFIYLRLMFTTYLFSNLSFKMYYIKLNTKFMYLILFSFINNFLLMFSFIMIFY